ncbi:sensor histidine kinase [Sphingomonas yantingensis]|uniref:histidine kinase n=1 Tax=Sphingomonas yantingensis TaxID=1241761 RepID=A0A7W9EIG4_9SPHN|nr:ATP-binding protein [Sphingomonas yantingensis]MBB5699162.1 C4-dicarboxylate-specific signal transduction histidine kinase [Sphingomonas yantingensis]
MRLLNAALLRNPVAKVAAPVLIALLIAAIFVVDTLTDLEIAVAVFYVIPVLLSARALRRRSVMALALACVGLTLVSSLLTREGSWEAGAVNLAISGVAILITASLALRLLAAEAAFGEARAQLIRVSRVSNLGELAGSIAHEVNQPLGAIAATAAAATRWLAADTPQVEEARASLERIAADARRAGEIVTRIRRLSQRRPAARERVDLNDVARETVALARREIEKAGVKVIVVLSEPLPPVMGDSIQLQQVAGNILANALDAVAAIAPDRRVVEVLTRALPDDRVMLRISDSGGGIAPADMPHIFDSLWTRKDGGTGLGLTIAQTIVESHGGHIAASSGRDGSGTCIQIILPQTKS